MTTQYQLWFSDEQGTRISPVTDYASFEYTKVVGDVDIGIFVFPYKDQTYIKEGAIDRRVTVLRAPAGWGLRADFVGFLRDWEFTTSASGQTYVSVIAYGPNHLLKRRHIAYYAEETETKIAAVEIDDVMKQIVRDNFITNADYSGTPSPSRSISGYGFSVASDLTAGPTTSKDVSWTNVLDTLQDLQADSKTQGNEVFFGVVPVNENLLVFQTWTGQPGSDRTQATGTTPMVFSLENSNLARPKRSVKSSDEITFMYGLGRGKNNARITQTASDTTRLGKSVLNRLEGAVDTGEELNAPTLAAAQRELSFSRPTDNLTGTLLNAESTPYGIPGGWNLGDKVTANYVRRQYDVIVRSVRVKVDEDGKETVEARIESE